MYAILCGVLVSYVVAVLQFSESRVALVIATGAVFPTFCVGLKCVFLGGLNKLWSKSASSGNSDGGGGEPRIAGDADEILLQLD